ncbi:MAG: DUF1697 domain-containing protein [Acidobacteria bacterium]|nr:DUF1697 domain-containing protein [Acidobacteriota bacterium]
MPRYAAFLRGMNLGRRRITNDELCGHVEALGFSEVGAFLASGNVVFDAESEDGAAVARHLATGLETALAYPVPTFVRSAEEVVAIAGRQPFTPDQRARSEGKLQVALLTTEPSKSAASTALDLATFDDQLALVGSELYWLPKAGVSTSNLDFKALETALGLTTVRTHRTLQRLAVKYFYG